MAMTDNIYRQETNVAPAPAPAPAPTPVTTVGGVPQVQSPALPANVVGQNYTPGLSMADIYKDPTILAFLRSSGLSEQVMANEIARRQAAVNQALGTNLQDLNARGLIERRNIAGSHEARGVFKSGANLQKQAEQEAQQARVQGALQQQAANQVADLSGNLAMQVAQNQQKAAELGTQTYIDRALAAGQSQIDTNYSSPTPEADEEEGY